MFWLFSRVNSKRTNQRSSFCLCFDCNWEFDEKNVTVFLLAKSFRLLFSSYKVVIGLVDPVGNTVELHDLKPYTYYQLDLRERHGQSLYASVNFSTAGNLWYTQSH